MIAVEVSKGRGSEKLYALVEQSAKPPDHPDEMHFPVAIIPSS
jgi:hypothetical protein